MATSLSFTVNRTGGSEPLMFRADRLVCCGWVGRDQKALEAHIEELAKVGVPRPRQVPIILNFSTYLLTHDPEITVVSDTSSGEVEYVLLCRGDQIWVSVGSDQTDRDIETKSIPASKQMCGKYLANTCWPFEEVTSHWDQLILRCWADEGGHRRLYQEAPLASILAPMALIRKLSSVSFPSDDGLVIFSGTIATQSGLIAADRYDLELEDPVLNRKITGSYRVRILTQHV